MLGKFLCACFKLKHVPEHDYQREVFFATEYLRLFAADSAELSVAADVTAADIAADAAAFVVAVIFPQNYPPQPFRLSANERHIVSGITCRDKPTHCLKV